MDVEETVKFWETVGTPMTFEDLKVGQAVLMEDPTHDLQRVVVITDIHIVGDNKAFDFREPWPGEVETSPTTVLVIA